MSNSYLQPESGGPWPECLERKGRRLHHSKKTQQKKTSSAIRELTTSGRSKLSHDYQSHSFDQRGDQGHKKPAVPRNRRILPHSCRDCSGGCSPPVDCVRSWKDLTSGGVETPRQRLFGGACSRVSQEPEQIRHPRVALTTNRSRDGMGYCNVRPLSFDDGDNNFRTNVPVENETEHVSAGYAQVHWAVCSYPRE
jgi:hypothetical protein